MIIKKTFQVEIWKMVWTNVQKSCLNDLETQESISLQPSRSLRPRYSLGNGLVFILDQC